MERGGEGKFVEKDAHPVKKLFLYLSCGWTLLIVCAAFYSHHHSSQTDIQLATLQAKTAFAKDIVYRRWNATKGGIYVPVSQVTPPNPYLSVPSRDIISQEKGEMTLINPSYMTRQVHELERLEIGVRSHITSLNPIRPANEADPWETVALKEFEKGRPEVYSLESVDGAPFLRYMKPLMVEASCLKCHHEQGYKIGDIRGGISVSIPMTPLRNLSKGLQIRSGLVLTVIWMSGLLLILLSHGRISRQLEREENAYREKEEMGSRLLQAQKMEAIGQMAAGIAHEINTPIQYLGTNVDFLQESFAEIAEFFQKVRQRERTSSEERKTIHEEVEELDWNYLSEEIPKCLTQSTDGLNHVSSFVQAMKVFSHPGSEDKVMSDINDVIRNVITVSQNEWKYVAELKAQYSEELPPVPLLTNEIRQVLLNIITNGVHAIQVKQEENQSQEKGEIVITTTENNGFAEIKISDSGSGIPEAELGRIFDLFYTTKEVGSGTGQGLYISYDIITNKHGGELLVESVLNVGTTFIIRLPFEM